MSENIAVYDSSGKQVESQLLPVVKDSISLRDYYATAYTGKSPSSTPKFTLAFTASVPPLGFSTYTIQSTKKPGKTNSLRTLQLMKMFVQHFKYWFILNITMQPQIL